MSASTVVFSCASKRSGEEDESDTVLLRNASSGYSLHVPKSRMDFAQDVRRRVRNADVQAVGLSENDISVDAQKRQYRITRHGSLAAVLAPSLATTRAKWLYVVLGAFAFAALAQAKFLFPCTSGYTAVSWKIDSYCVPIDRVGDVTPAACPADICSKRIPVTFSTLTFAAMLNGAVGGTMGVWATVLYVALVCVGAPFGSSGLYEPVWARGALVGSTGGFFAGFIVASLVMARCTQAGHDRPRSVYRLLPWLLAAEVCIYACGLFWLPFGMAIRRGVSPGDICPASRGAGVCLQNIANWGLVPFIPGEIFKMGLVMVTLPLAWQAALTFARWQARERIQEAARDDVSSGAVGSDGGDAASSEECQAA